MVYVYNGDLNELPMVAIHTNWIYKINKVGLHAGVVVNGKKSCDVDGWIWSTLSTHCGCVILECGTLGHSLPYSLLIAYAILSRWWI